MQIVTITSEAHDLIRANARAGLFKETGRRNADGTWGIPFSSDVVDHLAAATLNGETVSDTIVRLLSVTHGAN